MTIKQPSTQSKIQDVIQNRKSALALSAWVGRGELQSLPDEITEINWLTRLSVAFHRLNTLPDSLRNLKKLKTLDLHRNFFTEIPPVIFSLEQLEKLTLFSNRIKSIDGEWRNLTELQDLALKHNQIANIPPNLGSLPKLKNSTSVKIR